MPENFDENKIVAKLKDGRVIAKGTNSKVTTQTGTGSADTILVRVPGLREIDEVMHVQFSTDPITYSVDGLNPMNKHVEGNVVGMTIYGLNTTTTLTADVIAIGPP